MKTHVYGDAWRLAVAMRHPYPHPSETGEVASEQPSGSSSTFSYLTVITLTALVAGFIGHTLGEDSGHQKGHKSGREYAGKRAEWRAAMKRSGIDPDAPHMRGIYD